MDYQQKMSYLYHSPLSTNITTSVSSAQSYVTVSGSNGTSTNNSGITSPSIYVHGKSKFDDDVTINGNLKLNGIDLAQSLKRIEERLLLLTPNLSLESEWDELRELGERYRQLEQDMLAKLELVEILKKRY
jgi:hypothetical protein